MADVDITLSLPAELVERARAEGVLTNRRIARLLEAEIERLQAWRTLDQTLEPARQSFHAEHADMTEDDVMDMLNDLVHEVRADQKNDASEEQSKT